MSMLIGAVCVFVEHMYPPARWCEVAREAWSMEGGLRLKGLGALSMDSPSGMIVRVGRESRRDSADHDK